jgi:hypothetical protein
MSRMKVQPLILADEAEDADKAIVLSWRFQVLTKAGYSTDQAFQVARSGADLHLATDLVARGCPAETAVAILL